jgi:hypothetical protein
VRWRLVARRESIEDLIAGELARAGVESAEEGAWADG